MPGPITAILNLFRRLGWQYTLALSVALAAGSIVLAAFVVVGWPVDQFKGPAPPRFWATRHPVMRAAGLFAKNLAGYLIISLGIVMAVPGVPGQGTLLILTGLTLVNFPGKRRVERTLIRRPSILRMVNSLRRRFGHPALEID